MINIRKDLERNKNKRIGETNISNEGYEMKIIEYNGRGDVVVEFQDKYKAKVHVSYQSFKTHQVKNPYRSSVFNIGYIGQGKYMVGKNGKHTKVYECWSSLLERCYDAYKLNKEPTYIDYYVCDEWLNFQNFAKWYYQNYYEIENQKMHLDKDILCKGNKIYSPKTCIFVPQRINNLFVNQMRQRGQYPIGVKYHSRDNVLEVSCSILEKESNKRKNIYLGRFPLDKPFQAFTTYKNFKENYIKQVADEYKKLIPSKLYEAMYNYKIEIND